MANLQKPYIYDAGKSSTYVPNTKSAKPAAKTQSKANVHSAAKPKKAQMSEQERQDLLLEKKGTYFEKNGMWVEYYIEPSRNAEGFEIIYNGGLSADTKAQQDENKRLKSLDNIINHNIYSSLAQKQKTRMLSDAEKLFIISHKENLAEVGLMVGNDGTLKNL
jgi:hypothetical protein